MNDYQVCITSGAKARIVATANVRARSMNEARAIVLSQQSNLGNNHTSIVSCMIKL